MPALANPRHESFAQALFASLSEGQGYSQGKAYRAAGYLAKPGASADSAASSRLRKFKGIIERVRELQAESLARRAPAIDLSRERVGHDLDEAYRTAKEERNATAMVASALGIAKVFHADPNVSASPFSFKDATSMHDIGRELLLTVGMQNPSETAISAAIEANDAFVSRLEAIAAHNQD